MRILKPLRPTRCRTSQAGVALLISIFVLLLVCVVAIALIVSSGTESALSGNYRSATAVYYAALAGLEETRGRMLPKNPDYFLNYKPSFLPAPGNPLPLGSVSYVLNPVGGETIAPWDPASLYPDNEYAQEFGGASPPVAPPQMQWINSVSGSNASSIQGPLFKWVRINAVTERSLGININNSGGPLDSSNPVYYDGVHLTHSITSSQVFSITAYAALPNGSSKLLQYTVAPNSVTLPPFPAAVTIVGNNVDYTGPDTNGWFVNGNDTISLGTCSPGGSVYAVGYSNSADGSNHNINQGTFTRYSNNYTGQGGSMPNLGFIGAAIPLNFQTEAGLNAIAQNIIQDQLYDKYINRNATGADMPSGMSPSNLMTIVVNGDLDLSNNFHSTGYGLLIVNGNFTYDPDSSWYGIVMVVGQGTVSAIPGRAGDNGQIVGALFVAKTTGGPVGGMPGTSLPDSGDFNAEFPDSRGDRMNGGNGIFYSSCWIKASAPTGSYHIISFHEITQ